MFAAVALAATGAASSSDAPMSAGTVAIAGVGALSAIVVALVPELFKLLRPERVLPVQALVTPAELAALEVRLTERGEARAAATRAVAQGAAREVRALRVALEARDREAAERVRVAERDVAEQFERLRDQLQHHLWADHAGDPRLRRDGDSGSGPIPTPRPEPA